MEHNSFRVTPSFGVWFMLVESCFKISHRCHTYYWVVLSPDRDHSSKHRKVYLQDKTDYAEQTRTNLSSSRAIHVENTSVRRWKPCSHSRTQPPDSLAEGVVQELYPQLATRCLFFHRNCTYYTDQNHLIINKEIMYLDCKLVLTSKSYSCETKLCKCSTVKLTQSNEGTISICFVKLDAQI